MNGMSRQGRRISLEADSESAQEYQDSEFSDELGLSDPTHPLFPTCLCPATATGHIVWGSQNWQTRGRSRICEH